MDVRSIFILCYSVAITLYSLCRLYKPHGWMNKMRYDKKCPRCGSTDVSLDDPEWDSHHYERINVDAKCEDCGYMWGMSADVSMDGAPIWTEDITEDEAGFREDQRCQDISCGAAPLGCSDKRYCPRERGDLP